MGINLSKRTISLDLQDQGFIQTIYVQENDSSDVRELTIYVYDDGNEYTIDTSAQIKLVGTRSDGKTVMRYIGKDEGESITENHIILRFRNEEICCKGISKYKIEFYDKENRKTLSSFPFRLVVDKNSYDKNGLMATPVIDEIRELEDAIENAESQRVTAENTRVQAETERKNDETNRNTAERNRVEEENVRVSAENSRVQAENARVTSENARAITENNRVQAEDGRRNAENTRIQSENTRATAEDNRVNAENERVASENERVQEENDRKQAENTRTQSESTRVTAENTRKQSEDSRVQSENTRIENENARVTAENNRVTAENNRVEQERIRQEDNEAIKSIVEEANTLIESVGTSEENALQSATIASQKANESSDYSNLSKSYAMGTGGQSRTGDDTDCSKYYYEQAKSISESFAGALRPMGTVTFTNLPAVSSATEGDMYNISDQFTTTADFKEGTGNVVPAGANVYRTADGKWDVLAGSPVTSVNGQRGNVNITPENIGALPTAGGAMTGNIAYKGSKQTYDMIKWIDNPVDVNGNGVSIGGGGAVLIGGGESTTLTAGLLNNGGDERLILSNDGYIDVYTNTQTGMGAAKHFVFGTDGKLTAGGFCGPDGTDIITTVNGLKKSVSDGKSLVASAITAQGVTTAADAAFATLATNINTVASNKYSAGVSDTKKGTAVASNVLSGKTFTSEKAGIEVKGTMRNNPTYAEITSIDTAGTTAYFRILDGYHPSTGQAGSGVAEIIEPLSSFGNAGADHVLSGKTFTSTAGIKQSGTMENRGAVSKNLNPGETYTIPAGYHNGSGKVVNNAVARIEYMGGIGPAIAFPNENYYAVRWDTRGNKIVNYAPIVTAKPSEPSTIQNKVTSYGTWVAHVSPGWYGLNSGVEISLPPGDYVTKVIYAFHNDSGSGAVTYFRLSNAEIGTIVDSGQISNTGDFVYTSLEIKFTVSKTTVVRPHITFGGPTQGVNIYGFDIWKIV